jgi:hypothetical protein
LCDGPHDLTQAISQLREVLAIEPPLGFTTEYLVQLQNAIAVAERELPRALLNFAERALP